MKQEKIIKKIYAIVMSIVMMFTIIPVNFVVAATPVSLTVSADKTEVNPGDEVKLSIDIAAESNIMDAQFVIKYDNTKLDLVKEYDEDDNPTVYENSIMRTKMWSFADFEARY